MSEWGPWIEHDGKGCPCAGAYVQAKFSNGIALEGVVSGVGNQDHGQWDWQWAEKRCMARIIRYRIRKPRGLTILEEIARGVKEPQEVGA
ncbi:hypothetical protein [Mameliella alba]|uniref:hypothetical protein n=1 Tax=Mameliella alba TaxID=561184 RepID=UPI001054E4F4|nr:hypothetical protein [Mameliella alba]